MIIQAEDFKRLKKQPIALKRGINLLVGANGSGKSSLLEYIFKTNLGGKVKVAYSSGVNESFSSIYEPILKKNIRKAQKSYFQYEKELKEFAEEVSGDGAVENPDEIFYFDKTWAPFLILTSTFLKRGNKATQYWLDQLGFKIERFEIVQKFSPSYRKKISTSQEMVSERRIEFGFESSTIHKFISSLSDNDEPGTESVQKTVIPPFDVDATFVAGSSISDQVNKFFFDKNTFGLFTEKSYNKDWGFVEFFKLLQVATSGASPLIPLKEMKLFFITKSGQKISLNDISDGEFQLLTTASLIDIFDSDQTIFLLDEVDAHIHPKIISPIWKLLEETQGVLLTSSHNMMSLSLTDINKISFLDDGTILNEFRKKKGVLDSLYGAYFSAPVANSLFYSCKNIFIFDGLADWDIFKALCGKSGRRFDKIEADSVYVAKSSNTNKPHGIDDLLSPKLEWVENFISSLATLDTDPKRIKLKNFILICDKDDVDLGGRFFYKNKSTRKIKGYQATIHQFIWNRRCIENYLISKSARVHFISDVTQEVMIDTWGLSAERVKSDSEKFRKTYVGSHREIPEIFFDSDSFNPNTIKSVNCKSVVHSLVFDNNGINKDRLDKYVQSMDASEVDPYLLEVYSKLLEIVES